MENTIQDIIQGEKLIYAVLSNLKKKNEVDFNKVSIKPVLIREEKKFQFTFEYEKKVIHKNLESLEAIQEINRLLNEYFRQAMFFTTEADYQILISKKGKATILKKNPTKENVDLSHNRKKAYIIEDGIPCDFLIRLGVMNENGKVFSKKYDKFRQINRFIEMVADVMPRIKTNKTLNIVDFGCGKSYLTFALYHYLINILNLNVNIIGLDLKHDVINFCNEVAKDLDYNRLKFIHGDIKDFRGYDNVDMVVTLHACDTATDAALVKAVNWEAQAILSVPCCQHELLDTIHNPLMIPMERHGIIKEKLSSLVTDSIRANILEILGYSVQLMEFIDMEHTPKNILIRAIKTDNLNRDAVKQYLDFKEFWGIEELYIEKELGEKLKRHLNL
ncbi:SAM-dependent methyltransferase [Proteiniborus sp. MB09-C3]|uniref:class I SAM-dependent methyltransferase n=1 Tax=Proteiniborus sp. MB09-C3 TaxID=3050072 RepID=UPI002554C1C3|nr:SAM-dependent methyltransferase [Proteiniborus sp. MB09-C3]WIV11291.1 SAM-dependent methyltransferase [Proteiniborus sp. MB09-C3]